MTATIVGGNFELFQNNYRVFLDRYGRAKQSMLCGAMQQAIMFCRAEAVDFLLGEGFQLVPLQHCAPQSLDRT